MARIKQVWLKKEVTINRRGHFEYRGDDGTESVVVEVDQATTKGLQLESAKAAILAMHRQIQDAARRKHAAGESSRVHFHYSDRFKHNLIGLTDEDLERREGTCPG
jgi:hypothetical protein